MKTILRTTLLAALLLAGLTLNSQAAMSPDNVGDVTLYGNITANSPMWQWTVNDYPGAPLVAESSKADTSVSGKVTYPLTGQWFIAASGYLPSYVPGKIGTVSNIVGMTDITTLSSPDGAVTVDLTGTTPTVTIPATRSSSSGTPETGTLALSADEVRGFVKKRIEDGSTVADGVLFANNFSAIARVDNGSCWVGRAAGTDFTRSQTMTSLPTWTDTGVNAGSGATSAYNTALAAADAAGQVRYSSVGTTGTVAPLLFNVGRCSSSNGTSQVSTYSESYPYEPIYAAAAHVLALKPVSVSFPSDAAGAWNATLTVTAYQM